MKKNTTVTIAISAYNEERNIRNFISTVLAQKEAGFRIEKILIISDGSTDNTVKIAKSFKSLKMVIKDCKKRIGKSSRLNEIYASLTSDILVQSDCDVIFAHPYVVRDIIKPLLRNKMIGMCGGNPQPIESETFIEKSINYLNEIFIGFRSQVDAFSADGRLLAYKKELVKKINVPSDMIANDLYTFYCCLTLGYKYKFVKSAVVYFRSPQTLRDLIRQNVRFCAARLRMEAYFDKKIIRKQTYISPSELYKSMFLQLIKHPISFSAIWIVSKYCQYKAIRNERRLNELWEMANTTKSLN